MSEQYFTTYEDTKKWIDSWIFSKDEEFFGRGIRMLPEIWEKVVSENGGNLSVHLIIINAYGSLRSLILTELKLILKDEEMKIKNRESLMTFVKGSVGTGVLAMPFAFTHCGYMGGVIGTALVSIIAVYCLHIMINTMYGVSKRQKQPYIPYNDAMTISLDNGPGCMRCFTPFAGPLVNIFLFIFHYGVCCVYVLFVSENVKMVVDYYGNKLPLQIYIIILCVPFCVMFRIRNLKILAAISQFANFLLVIGFGILLYYIFKDGMPPFGQTAAFESVTKYPIFFGIVLFALESVGVVLSLDREMKTPKDYVGLFGVMNQGMAFVSISYGIIGFCGYWKYGYNVAPSITLNTPEDELLSQTIKLIFAVAIFLTYPVHGFVAADILWNHFLVNKVENPEHHIAYEIKMRYIMGFITICAALVVPQMKIMMTLFGALTMSTLGIIFPAVMEMCFRYPTTYGSCYIHLVKDICLIIFGVLGGVSGTYISLVDIFKLYM